MSTPIKLIVGLGNPGAEYENTRHNAGAWFVTEIANQQATTLRHETKFQGAVGKLHIKQHECLLLIPSTFMNHSGQAVIALANYYKILPQEILVAHDELDLPVGEIRLKQAGGHGGHNGLRNIIDHLHSADFVRLRIGIGRPPAGSVAVDYVLSRPSVSDRKQIATCLIDAANVLDLVTPGELEKAMQKLHTKGKNDGI